MKIFKNKLFMKLFFSRMFVLLADSMLFLTILKWFELKTGSDFDTYYIWVVIISYLPSLLFSYPIGSWAESRYFQKTMMTTNVLRVILLIILMVSLSVFSPLTILIYLLIEGILYLFYAPSSQSLLVHIIDREDRPVANTVFQISFVVFQTLGMIVSSIFIKMDISISYLIGIVILFIALSTIFISQIKPFVRNEEIEDEKYLDTFKNGLKYLAGEKILLKLFSLMFIAWTVAGSIEFLIMIYVNKVWKIGIENFSFISGSYLLGTLIGAGLFPFLARRVKVKTMVLAPTFIYPFVLMSLNLFSNFLMTLPFFFIGGITLGIFQISLISFLQLKIERKMFTRVMSIHSLILSLGPIPGMFIFILLSNFLETSTIVTILALSLLILGLSSIFYLPKIDTLPNEKNEMEKNKN